MTNYALHSKRVWITGASSGIGKALALRLLALGNRVAVSARNQPALRELAQPFPPEQVLVLPMDVTVREDHQKSVALINQQWGGLDIALPIAGSCEYVNTRQFDSEIFYRMLQVNTMGIVYAIEAALPLLRRSSTPYLVAMSSLAAYAGLPRAEAYGASKAAVLNLLEGLRIDCHAEGIPVSIICPGFVATPLTASNDFPMPFLLSVDQAVDKIIRGMRHQTAEIRFPWLLTSLIKLLHALPAKWYTWIMAKVVARR